MFDRTKADRLHELEQGLSIAVIQESPSEDISQSDQDTNNITASKPVTYSLRPKSIPTYYALGMMMYRAFLNQFRQPLVISSRISQVFFISDEGIVISCVFVESYALWLRSRLYFTH